MDRNGVGVVLGIVKEGKAKNSAITMVFSGREEIDEVDPWPFVSTLGKVPSHLVENGAVVSSTEPSQSPFLSFPSTRAM